MTPDVRRNGGEHSRRRFHPRKTRPMKPPRSAAPLDVTAWSRLVSQVEGLVLGAHVDASPNGTFR